MMLLPCALLFACSTPNSQAPSQGKSHVANYLVLHSADAKTDFTRCTVCHGSDYKGSGNAPSCLTCHEQGPPFTVHSLPYADPSLHGAAAKSGMLKCQACHGTAPNKFDGGIMADPAIYNNQAGNCSQCHPAAGAHPTNWIETDTSTNGYRSTHVTVSFLSANCNICHDYIQGRTAPNPKAPSCFSAQFTNADGTTTSCHAGGFTTPPHVIPYTSPQMHGTNAKSDLSACQECHGTPGTTKFDGGIAFTRCSTSECHPAASAHPTNWLETDASTNGYQSTHINAGNRSSSCALCHDYTQGRTAPNPKAPSCFSAQFTNADGTTSSCHTSGGVSAPHAIPYTAPEAHGASAGADIASCQQCHGTPGTTGFDGGTASTKCSTCHTAASAHPTNWQGSNDNTSPYFSTHRTSGNRSTSCSICHDYTQGRTAPNPKAPSCFSAQFTNADGSTTACHPSGGSGAPHAIPYTLPETHGAAAKPDLSACQQCHGTPGTTKFDGGTATTKCSSCHTAAHAHPTRWQGNDDNTSSYRSTHRNAGNRAVACALCHDYTPGRTAPDPSAPSCFTARFTNADGVTSSCHGD
jgi:hypothetical protein